MTGAFVSVSAKSVENIFWQKASVMNCAVISAVKHRHFKTKREFDERARENNYDLLYKNECQNWRNKIKPGKKIPQAFRLTVWKKIQASFSDF